MATAKDFTAENRKEFCSKIATQDFDAVIMGYTQFEKIPISKERLEALIQTQVDELVDAIEEMRQEGCEKFSIKQAELKKKSLTERLEALQNDKADDTITFEELGVDRLYVDEAHITKIFLPTPKCRIYRALPPLTRRKLPTCTRNANILTR